MRKFNIPYGLLAILIILGTLLVILARQDSFLMWDENAHLANARSYLGEANYEEIWRFPAMGLTVASIWAATGESILVGRLLTILFSLASVVIFYLVGKKYFDETNATVLAAIFAFSTQVLFWGFRVYPDIPAMFFVLLAFYLLLENRFMLAGIVSTLAFLYK